MGASLGWCNEWLQCRGMKRLAKILKVVLLISVLVLLSEIIYMGRRNELSKPLVYYSVNKAKRLASVDRIDEAFSTLKQTAQVNLMFNAYYYGNIPSKYGGLDGYGIDNQAMKDAFKDIVSELSVGLLMHTEQYNLARLYYELALASYETSDLEFVEPMLQLSVYLSPNLSHYHVELANYYLMQDNYEGFVRTLEYCLEFEYPKEHCAEFRSALDGASRHDEVGFLREEVEKYYTLKRQKVI